MATPIRTRRKRRDWPDAEKARLIAETMLPRANVAAFAPAEGLDPSQLYGWRRKALASGSVVPLLKEANVRASFILGWSPSPRSRPRRPKDALLAFGAFAAAPCMG
nr:transposase [Sinorhizobium meliloti]